MMRMYIPASRVAESVSADTGAYIKALPSPQAVEGMQRHAIVETVICLHVIDH